MLAVTVAGERSESRKKEGKTLRPLPRERVQEHRETRVLVTRSSGFTLGKVFYLASPPAWDEDATYSLRLSAYSAASACPTPKPSP